MDLCLGFWIGVGFRGLRCWFRFAVLSLLCCLGCLRKLFCFGLNLLVGFVWNLVGFGAVACLDTLWAVLWLMVLMTVGVWCVVCCGLNGDCGVGVLRWYFNSVGVMCFFGVVCSLCLVVWWLIVIVRVFMSLCCFVCLGVVFGWICFAV